MGRENHEKSDPEEHPDHVADAAGPDQSHFLQGIGRVENIL
jgi:hypothetical protein